jgi:transcriptional regulator with GAF, ATPase, and Fis domain
MGASTESVQQRFPNPQYLTDYASLLDASAAMRSIKSVVEDVADLDATVLIRGESGVGKDVVARAIHAASSRHERPFVKVNCAALPSELLESELFGHERGAFTGAYRRKLGQFEYANGGSIYLDEIGELPPALQAKLLHVLQDFRFSRVGGPETITVDTRIIAATNSNLERAMEQGHFRSDLYYRLAVVELHIPPLRERRDEIPHLVTLFLDRFNRQYGRSKTMAPELLARLTAHPWHGNVRELENFVRRFVLLNESSGAFDGLLGRRASSAASPSSPLGTMESLRDAARRAARAEERKVLAEILDRVHWNRAEAARLLKVSYKTLLNKISETGLTPPSRRSA